MLLEYVTLFFTAGAAVSLLFNVTAAIVGAIKAQKDQEPEDQQELPDSNGRQERE